MNRKEIFRQAVRDRTYLVALVATILALLSIIILGILEIRPSELQVPLRNTVFGITYTYREQWYSELSFVGFGLLVAVLHTFISLKLYALKDRRYAIAFQWLTVLMLVISFVVMSAVFRVISIVE